MTRKIARGPLTKVLETPELFLTEIYGESIVQRLRPLALVAGVPTSAAVWLLLVTFQASLTMDISKGVSRVREYLPANQTPVPRLRVRRPCSFGRHFDCGSRYGDFCVGAHNCITFFER